MRLLTAQAIPFLLWRRVYNWLFIEGIQEKTERKDRARIAIYNACRVLQQRNNGKSIINK